MRTMYLTGLAFTASGLACSSKTSQHPPDTFDAPASGLADVTKLPTPATEGSQKAKVYLVNTEDRKQGVKRCMALLCSLGYAGKKVLVKPNFNTADPAPASTHNDTLEQLLLELQSANVVSLTVGERSGPPLTLNVLTEKGVPELCEKLGVGLINYDQLPPAAWIKFDQDGLNWRNGFLVAKPVFDADINVATCCLKTHAYGGVFSMSLKLAVGLLPRRGYPLMDELHRSPQMQKMIAEINLAYHPDFVLMDGVDVFVDGGPDRGKRKRGNVMLLSQDRVALDAVGLAVLKDLGSNKSIMERPIFAQEQIRRAVELKIGVSSPDKIEIIADDEKGKQYTRRLTQLLEAETQEEDLKSRAKP